MDYKRIYDQLIIRGKRSDRKKGQGIYYEAHHIIPKCVGGTGLCYNHDHPNIVLLTVKEHFIAHLLLVKIYPDNVQLQRALWCMLGLKSKKMSQRYKPSSRLYEQIRTDYIKASSGVNNKFYGKKQTIETKEKISNAQKGNKYCLGRKYSDETILKMSKRRMGVRPSEETREKLRLKRAANSSLNALKVICLDTGELFDHGGQVAKHINRSRRSVYRWLKNPHLAPDSFHYIRIIDFSKQ